jgi:cytoskeletal protein CcmA (bactofilin family)
LYLIKKDQVIMARNNTNEAENNSINIIGEGTSIRGDINCHSDIRIDGSLEGNISTTGKIVIGKTGIIKGEAKCKTGDISGIIEGKISASELLTLKETSKINGDMLVQKLAVEPGCIFTGNCKMDTEEVQNVKSFPKREEDKTKEAI